MVNEGGSGQEFTRIQLKGKSGKVAGTCRVLSRFEDSLGRRMVRLELVNLDGQPDPDFPIGTVMEYPAEGFVGVFQKPEGKTGS